MNSAPLLLLVLSWLVPDHFLPWGAFYNDFLAFLGVVVFIALKPRVLLFTSGLSFFYIVIVSLWVIQFFNGVYFYKSDIILAFIYVTGAYFAYLAGFSGKNNEHIVFIFALLVLLGGGVSCIIGIIQWLDLSSIWVSGPTLSGRAVGNLGQPNNYATLMIWSIVTLYYLFGRGYISVFLFVFLSILFNWAVVISESRTPLLQYIWILGFLFYYRKQQKSPFSKVAFLPLLSFVFLYLSYPYINHVLLLDDETKLKLVEGNYHGRISIWISLIPAILNSGFWGYGWGGVSVAQFTNLLDSPISHVEYVTQSHNLLFDLILWCGPLIGFLVIGFFVFWIGRRVLHPKTHESWFLLSCIIVLLIHGMLEYPQEYAYFLFPAFWMLGVVDQESGVKKKRYAWPIQIPMFFVFCFISIWVAKEYLVIEEDHRLMRGQNFGLQVDKGLRLSKDLVLLDKQKDFIRFARQKAHKGMSMEELDWFKRVTYSTPIAVSIYRYSVALGLNGRMSEALMEMQKLEKLNRPEEYLYYSYFFKHSIDEGREI
ncbi:PglL family O-oligosaccharyltransferase [Gynuella sunshinyii]|uniref:Lipid A core-O-antigen ligase-related enzyme n=1 Tax=Gynuella sunshinyii YC6258 TaxID=1445510 RepID=A0A0C5VJI0_9GAMM|nr:Wzy polymerase domain-containing protein [Gynuella sunshinyii]AJQ94446.1 lipid A core - O-antigen ligase-related enzyme [Gynuella sunshinyii YC6258]